jgi:phosphonate transport system substrate-binding protein
MDSELKITTCLAANTEPVGRAVANYMADRLQISVRFIDDISWQERERGLDQGQIHVGWICGLLYVWKCMQAGRSKRRPYRPVELLAAPVMDGKRYENQPVYFSDVIVRRDSLFHSLEDLRGATLAYNEPRSYSGYAILCYHLATRGYTKGYFGKAIESGAHLHSLQMVLSGEADTTAIDSTILDCEFENNPALRSQLRVVAVLGPSPIPPWVIFGTLPDGMRHDLRGLMLEMNGDVLGRQILRKGQLNRFTSVSDVDYDPIRNVAQYTKNMSLKNR